MNKINELNCIASEIYPDLICICESWTREDIQDSYLNISNYNLVSRKDRKDTKRGIGGGLLIFAKNELNVSELNLDLLSEFNQCTAVSIKIGKDQLNLCLIYRPHNLYDSKDLIENNNLLCDLLKQFPKPFLIVGDFNFSDIDWDNGTATVKSKDFYCAVQDSFLTQHVDFPSHKSGTMPDLVLSSNTNMVSSISNCGPLGSSDHCMILTELNLNPNRKNLKSESFNWKKADFNSLRSKINDINWGYLLQDLDANAAWDTFSGMVNKVIEDNVPKSSHRASRRPPWMKGDEISAIRRKKTRWRTFTKTQTKQDFLLYKKAVKEVKKTIKKAKKKFEKNLAKDCKSNPRAFYGYLNSKKSNRTTVGPLKVNDVIVDQDKDMANSFNDYFSTVFTSENTAFIPSLDSIKPDIREIQSEVFSRENISKKLKKLKPFSAAGPDNLKPIIYKELADELSIPLCTIFQKSYDTGVVPKQWRQANVTPIFKKGKKSESSNYRPVSLTCVAGKVMESLLKDVIVEHLNENNLIFSSQHGFVKNRSCLTNLLEYLETLQDLVDKGNCVDVAYLDFSKAFDKVPHKRLNVILEAHGITGKLKEWIVSWLSDRQQRVVLNGETSRWLPVTSGVPQGSVLGPILFIIFINTFDLDISEEVNILSKFADDAKVGRIVNNLEDAEKMQQVLVRLMEWADTWQMNFNLGKCQILHFGRDRQDTIYTLGGYPPAGCILTDPGCERDIGVIISTDMKPSIQCITAAKKANQTLGRMAKAFSYRDKKVWLKLYTVYVRPLLEYAVQAWYPWMAKDIKVLEDIQKRAVRMTSGLKGNCYEEKLKEAGLYSLEERRKRGDAIQVWKILTRYDHVDEKHWFERCSENSSQDTRLASNILNLKHKSFNSDWRKHSFSVRAPKLWNEIPDSVRSSKTLNTFKKKYDEIYGPKHT